MLCLSLSCVFQPLAYLLQVSLWCWSWGQQITLLLPVTRGNCHQRIAGGLEENKGLFLNVCLLVAVCVAPAQLLHPNSSNWLQLAVLPILQKSASSHCLWLAGIGWPGWACQSSEHELPSAQQSESQLPETRPPAPPLCFPSPRETHCFLFAS